MAADGCDGLFFRRLSHARDRSGRCVARCDHRAERKARPEAHNEAARGTMPITLPFITVSFRNLTWSGGHASPIARVAVRHVLDEGV
ncbi:hypothetical protein J2126_002481 [Xanthobacter flavus]|nr:hypothetical protein [Xanthobacter flavus]